MDNRIIYNIAYMAFFLIGYFAGSAEKNWMPVWVYILGFIGAFVLIKLIENRPEIEDGPARSD